MSGKILEIESMSGTARRAVERRRNWTHLSVFLILALAMMAALAGLGIVLFLLVDRLLLMLG